MEWQSNESKLCLKGVNTFRIGAEYKVIPQFALRAGYNYSSSAFKKDAIKALFSAGEISIIYSTINRLSGYDDGAVTEVKN